MDNAQYTALVGYICRNEYPSGYNKAQKFVLRRSSKNFVVEEEKLFYIDFKSDGSSFRRLVLQGEEADRVFTECHLSTGGHRGRDTTIAKIKERYYWYKEIEQKVRSS